jgi:hypothetical protein
MPPRPPGRQRKRTLADKLQATPGTRFAFTQKQGSRKGQRYNVVTGKSGLAIRKYAGGDTAVAETDSGVDIAAQRRDVGQRAKGSGTTLRDRGVAARGSALATGGSQLGAKRSANETLKRQRETNVQDSAAVAQMAKTYAGMLKSGKRTYKSRAKSAQMKLSKVRVRKGQ